MLPITINAMAYPGYKIILGLSGLCMAHVIADIIYSLCIIPVIVVSFYFSVKDMPGYDGNILTPASMIISAQALHVNYIVCKSSTINIYRSEPDTPGITRCSFMVHSIILTLVLLTGLAGVIEIIISSRNLLDGLFINIVVTYLLSFYFSHSLANVWYTGNLRILVFLKNPFLYPQQAMNDAMRQAIAAGTWARNLNNVDWT